MAEIVIAAAVASGSLGLLLPSVHADVSGGHLSQKLDALGDLELVPAAVLAAILIS